MGEGVRESGESMTKRGEGVIESGEGEGVRVGRV